MHDGHRQRLRERYEKEGLDSFAPHEILELLLFYAIPRKDTNRLAHAILNKFGTLTNVFQASPEELQTVEGLGKGAAVFLSIISDVLRRCQLEQLIKLPTINSVREARECVISLFAGKTNEECYLISLTKQNKVKHISKICSGTPDETPFYPRLIAEAALLNKASKVIIAHNHPGGTLTPSEADIETTKVIKNMFQLMGIELIDHIIVAGNNSSSMAMLNFI